MLRIAERIYISLAGIWLFILVWCYVLGLQQVPAWNGFVLWYSSYQPDIQDFTSFMDKLRGVFAQLETVSADDLQRVANPDATETATIFAILAVFFDTFIVFIRSVGTVLVGFVTVVVNSFVYIIPQVLAFIAFLSGSFFVNNLPGAGGVIDWASNSGAYGYPDQSFVGLVFALPSFVG